MKTITHWIRDVHENAKDKGWWSDRRSFSELMLLAICEVTEAVEEVRKRTPPVYRFWNGVVITPTHSAWEIAEPKLEGEAVELADVIIRLFDAAGSLGWELKDSLGAANFLEIDQLFNEGAQFLPDEDDSDPLLPHMDFVEILCAANAAFDGLGDAEADVEEMAEEVLCTAILEIAEYFHRKGWDLEQVMQAKHEYNKTRPYRHGNKAH